MKKLKFLIVTTIPSSLGFFKGQIKILKKGFDVEVLSSGGKGLDTFCESEDVLGHVVEMEREISIFKDLRSFINMLRKLNELKPFCVHGNTPKGALISMMAAWFLRVPKRIYYIHGLRYEGTQGFKRNMLIFMEKLTCFFASDIFVVSNGILNTVKNEGITNKTINLIYNGSINGLDTKKYSLDALAGVPCVRREYNIPEDFMVLGFVGRLVNDKGVNNLVKVFSELNKKHTKIHLLLVGRIELTVDPISEWTQNEIKCNKNISYVGFQSDVRPFLKAMDVFVFPSFREGFGISLMEALAMEIPCVSSNITGCNEIIQDGINGFLVEPRNNEDLYTKIEVLIENQDIYKLMKINSRKSVVQRYEQNKLWDETLIKYNKVLKIDNYGCDV